ncbi:MAG: hypothetical protein AAGG69_14360 [Pseudomonadota bacterium]
MAPSNPKSFDLMRDALSEAQMTVRAYDTKAQIVGVGYIFALGIVMQIGDVLPVLEGNPLAVVFLSWAVVLFPIFHFGHVLYPTRKTAPKLSQDLNSTLKRVLYVEPERVDNVEDLRNAFTDCDPYDEYCYELLKTSTLRELKRKRFLRGLISTTIAFLVLFLNHLFRGLA